MRGRFFRTGRLGRTQGGVRRVFLQVVLAVGATATFAADLPPPPHVPAAGREDFAAYRAAAGPKAFAIAPGGAWAWVAGEASGEAARRSAVERCAGHTEQDCVPYAVDDRRVLDDRRWPTLWRLPVQEAGQGAVGLRRGATFPDLAFADATGKARRLSEWRGQVVVLHFWGSWCGPCRHELPEMAGVARALAGQRIVFVPLQVRESFAASRRWIEARRIRLTLFDSGVQGSDDGMLRIAGGGTLPDRAVAPAFPSSVVLDRSGRVAFVHTGPIERWVDYVPFLRDMARH